MAALVLGYDVAGRLATAFTARPLAHQNGQVSLLAAAAAGLRIHRGSADEVSRAMRISTTLVLTPSYTNAVAGATALNVAGGMSSFVGAFARDLVLAGFEAQKDAVEEALSQLVGSGFDASILTNDLGKRWHIAENYFRLHACCNPVHGALDSLESIMKKLAPKPEEIERIDIATYRFASVMRNPDPPNFFGSKYSLPHAAAVMIVKGNARHSAMDDTSLRDPGIAALRQRVHIAEDPSMSAVAPRLRPSRVTVTLKDGREMTESRESHRGDFNEPFEESELRQKFRELAGLALAQEGVAAVEAAVDSCAEWKSVHELAELMRRYMRH